MKNARWWALGAVGVIASWVLIVLMVRDVGGPPPALPASPAAEVAPPALAPARAERVALTSPVPLAARPAEAPRPAAPAPKDFAFLRYYADLSGAAPKACLTFSSALDPKTDYSAFLALEPAQPIALAIDGQTLCIGGLSFGAPRELTLRAGLPAADGRKLSIDETTTIDFGERPAFVGFKGAGVILPRLEADGLAIETVNVDTLAIKVWRVTDRALAFKRIVQGVAVAANDYYWTDREEDGADGGVLVWQGDMATPGPANASVTTVFPLASALGVLEPGAYFVQAAEKKDDEGGYRQPPSASRWIVFTDVALTSYEGGQGVDLTARSLQTGKPLRGVRLELIARSNEILAAAETDADGHARFDARLTRGQGAEAARLVTAYAPSGDFAVLDLERAPVDLSGQNVAGRTVRDGADVFVYLDRGIYRPGETVRISALLRDATGRGLPDRPGTWVVRRPNGLEAQRVRFAKGEAGAAAFLDFELAKSAARGLWRVGLELDGQGEVGAESFTVEDFVPQRVKLELAADEATPIGASQTRPLEAEARFLYGAPGAGLAIEGEARIERDPNPFPNEAGFRFGRHDVEFAEERLDLAATTADGEGKARMMLDPGGVGGDSSHPLRIHAVVGVLEPGGRAVRESVRVPYRPREVYLGLKAGFEGGSAPEGQPVAFEAIALGRDGARRAASLDWKVLRVDDRYDWYRDGEQWRWRRSRSVVLKEQGKLALEAGKAAAINIARLEWGDHELIVADPATGQEASYGFWVGWGGVAQDGVQAPDRVRLAAPAKPAAPGSAAEIAIEAPYAGEAEVVVATDRVLSVRTLSVPAGGAKVSVDVTEDWGAGAYVMVSVFTPRDPVARPTPRRAVGVAYVPVDMASRSFELTLDAPEVVRPRTTLPVKVKAQGGPRGEEAFVTLAAVDEGILRLTKHVSPDASGWYFGKKALQVALRDDYGRLLDPNQGAAAAVRAGGDQLGGEGLTVTPTKTVALFSGAVKLNGAGEATIPLALPDFNGELRLMAVAWSATGVGDAARGMIVRDPVPAELVLPRFLAPGDVAMATASIDNVEGEAGLYKASVRGAGAITAAAPALEAELAKGQRRDAGVELAATAEGLAEIALAVEGPAKLAVSRSYPIQVRSPYLPASVVSRELMPPGARYAPPADALAQFAPGSGLVTVSFSSLPFDPGALYDALDRYPYGCTEQITSRALPLLYASELAALAARAKSGDASRVLQEAAATILNRQGADGAIGLWREGDRYATPWLGAYATDFLARAKAKGVVVPEAALARSYEALGGVAQGELWRASGYDSNVYTSRWNPDTSDRLRARASAYALYVLARAGKADVSRLRYVHAQELAGMESPLARAHIGAALAYVGDRARAMDALAKAEAALGYKNEGDYYQTPRRDTAGVLALAAEAEDSALVGRLAERIAETAPEPNDLTTQEKAFFLLAAHALTGGEEGPQVRADGPVQGDKTGGVFTASAGDLAKGVSFENRGKEPVWRTTVARGAPTAAPPAASEGVAVVKVVSRMDGRAVDAASLVQGDRVVVQITITPRQRRTLPMIVADLLPAGFEIEGVLRPGDGAPSGPYRWLGEIASPRVAEARDDRFVAAIDLVDGKEATLAYVARAVTPGTFAAPGVVAEDMYRPDVFARSPGFPVAIAPRS